MLNAYVVKQLCLQYPLLVDYVRWHGSAVQSRVGETRELLNLHLVLNEPTFCLVGRAGMSDAFAYEEVTQLLAGVHDNERLAAIVPRAAQLITSPTAYGPRVKDQLLRVCDELKSNPSSRRAVIYVGRHDDLEALDDERAGKRAGEMPCTCVWQFHLRRNELSMTVYMRSWDVVWGLSYDIPSFVAVQLAVADHLGASVGSYTHFSGSAHIYSRHYGLETWLRPGGELDISHLLKGDIEATMQAALLELT